MWSFSKKKFGFLEKSLEVLEKFWGFRKNLGGFSKSFAVLEKNWGLSKNLGAGAREESQNPLVRTINFPGLGGGVTAAPRSRQPCKLPSSTEVSRGCQDWR